MNNTNVNVINSIIGFGTVFSGDLDLTGLLKIDGDFSGSVKAEGKVLIGELSLDRIRFEGEEYICGFAREISKRVKSEAA